MRSQHPDDSIIHVEAASAALDEFKPESAPAQRLLDVAAAGRPTCEPAASLSRLDSMQAQRRRRSRVTRMKAARRAALRQSAQAVRAATAAAHRYGLMTVQQARGAARTGAAIAERGMAGMLHTASHLQDRGAAHARQIVATTRRGSSIVHDRLVAKAKAAPRLFEQPEFDGVVLAILLAIVSVGYGGFLTVTWRQPTEMRSAAPPVQRALASTSVAPVVVPVANRLAEPIVVTGPTGTHHGAGFLSPRSLAALWKRRDTRSLEQAFTGLRQQTLAFHRCGVRKTGDDRAVARCEASGATWTIDFQRQAGRWQIANVVTR